MAILSLPLVSKPTPTPSIAISIKKQNGSAGSASMVSSVLINAQLPVNMLSASAKACVSGTCGQ